ncbi:MAG: hypothetical protein SFX73_18545 [Kofleriaceae bacterium]|nr:hypothetical protein [Kofleriaceae bacterium]
MADRPDIDALLISALYGELTPAEETRLASHLESHPADRTLLADLTHARDVVRESRILQVQFDPPQAVSALLLQEAARRAPKASAEEKEGWFARFVRSFAAHPAMAAAAMLVVVIGVATIVTRHKGDHFAETTAPAPTSKADQAKEQGEGALPPSPRSSEVASSADPGAASGSGTAPTEQYPVDLYAADKNQEAEGKPDEDRPLAKEAKPEAPKQKADKIAGNFGGTKGGVEVRSPSPRLKDFEDAPRNEAQSRKKSAIPSERAEESLGYDGAAVSTGTATIARGDVSGAGASGAAAPGTAASPPPPPPPTSAPAATATAPAGPRAGAAPTTDDARVPDPALAWAREQHQSVVAQVRAGNCRNAANLAVTLSTRAPGYYSQNVATDRQVKDCLAYINTEVSRDAELRAQRERVKRSEAASKRAADQPSKATTKSPAATTETVK